MAFETFTGKELQPSALLSVHLLLEPLYQGLEGYLALFYTYLGARPSRLRDKFALSQLCGVIALSTLFLVLQGTQVVTSGKRRLVDTHWNRGMSYLRLGWNWVRLALTRQWEIQMYSFLSSLPDPEPAFASKRQREKEFKREFTVLRRFPAS